MAITAKAGKNGLIYVSGTTNEIEGANAWTLNIEHDAIAYAIMGDEWESKLSGIKRWSGSIGSVKDHDGKLLSNAAVADATVAVLIYPDRTDGSTYYSGSAIFSFSNEADFGSAISASVDFEGHSTLTITGFA